VFHLKAGIDFEKEELVPGQEKFDRADSVITDVFNEPDGRFL
jgi:hypothetical protein